VNTGVWVAVVVGRKVEVGVAASFGVEVAMSVAVSEGVEEGARVTKAGGTTVDARFAVTACVEDGCIRPANQNKPQMSNEVIAAKVNSIMIVAGEAFLILEIAGMADLRFEIWDW
jgi:hypothetical protein